MYTLPFLPFKFELNLNYFNFRPRNTGRSLNINTSNQRTPQINIETNTQNDENNTQLINDDFEAGTLYGNGLLKPILLHSNVLTFLSIYEGSVSIFLDISNILDLNIRLVLMIKKGLTLVQALRSRVEAKGCWRIFLKIRPHSCV